MKWHLIFLVFLNLKSCEKRKLKAGEVAATPMPGAHAEVTALMEAANSGSTPMMIGTSRPICAECAAYIQSQGGTLLDNFTAQW